MNVEWTEDLLLMWEIARKTRSGGLSPQERRGLVEQFGVSEEVLLRYERAKVAYDALDDKRFREAKWETLRRMTEGQKTFDPERYSAEMEVTLQRMREAEPESEITRELRDARAAIRAELGLSPIPPEAY